MPFRLWQSNTKEKHNKIKSKSTTNLYEGRTIITVTPELILPNNGLKSKSKSKLQLFLNNKVLSQIGIKQTKKNQNNKINNDSTLLGCKKTGSDIKLQNSEIESPQTNGNVQIQNDNSSTNNITLQKRSSSSCATLNIVNRERRLSDVAQLDQYIEYYQRRAADDGFNAKRLLCAQLLRQGLLGLEHKHQAEPIRSQNHILSHSISNLTKQPSPNNDETSCHFLKNKINQSRVSQWSSLGQQHEHKPTEQEKRRSSVSAVSYKDHTVQFMYKSNITASADNVHNYRNVSDPVDNSSIRDFFKKPKFMSKRRSVPSLLPVEIEIY